MTTPAEPNSLPWCAYPTASDTKALGLQPLPEDLLVANFNSVSQYRSNRYRAVPVLNEHPGTLLEMAAVLAASFAVNDPMNRHVHPSRSVPVSMAHHLHKDTLGVAPFGPWTTENIFYWFVRLFALTSANDPLNSVKINEDTLRLSLAIFNAKRKVIGAAINVTVPNEEVPMRNGDPFLEAVLVHVNPIMNLIYTQEHIAMQALAHQYPALQKARAQGMVGMHFLVARSPELPKDHTFELVAASAEHLQKQGFEYMVVTATNQWTGAACEVLGATRVHFAPFRDRERLARKAVASAEEPFSNDGYLAEKDSGMFFYVLKL
ncbi:MAG: hypothetical protein WBN18_00100 [Flavobacteriaceae bacterium]